MLNDSNWCPEIYRSIFIDRHNDDHIRVAPCCQAHPKVESVGSFNFDTSPYLQGLREKFNQGLRPPECARCWNVEFLGHKSRRQSAIEFFGSGNQPQDVILESIDYSSTWACNLSCIMCSEFNSSAWATELNSNKDHLQKLGRLFQKKNNFLDRLDIRHIKKIHFNGGEPMLNDDQSLLLERLDQQGILKNIFASYNTNGTIRPSDKIINLWSRAKLIKLFFSIDGTESAFEYIRYPGKWASTIENISEMKKTLPSNVIFGINITVGTYNVLELLSLYHWFQRNLSSNKEGDPSDFCWQFANNYDPICLPKEIKQHVIDELNGIDEYQGIITYLVNSINYITVQNWTQSLDQIDRRRGTNWRKSLRIGKYY